MATIRNDRDNLLQGTPVRNTDPTAGKALLLQPNSNVFRVDQAGAATPATTTITAKLINIKGTVTWSVSGASAVTPAGDTLSCTLAFANMSADLATVTAQVTYLGQVYTQAITIQKVYDGLANKTAQVTAYKRAVSVPTDNPGAVTYTFASGAITTPSTDALANGWTKTIPSGTDPLYIVVASAFGNGTTDAIASGEWTSPVKLAQDGAAGLNVATVFIYQRGSTSTPPALPSATATYTFTTGGLTGLNNGWVRDAASAGTGGYLFVSQATAASTTATDTVTAGEWATASAMAIDGVNGLHNGQAFAYKRAASAPSDNPGAVTYTFSSASITTPSTDALANGWTKSIPAGSNPLYVVVASAAGTGSTDAIASGEWSTPVQLVQDGSTGSTGAAGLNVATVFIYQRATTNSAPTLPSASTTYTFTTGGLTGLDNGWTKTIPGSGGAYLFVSQATAAATTSTDTITAGEWAAATLLVQNGLATATVYAYKRMAAGSIPIGDTGPGDVTYTFASNSITTPSTDTLGTNDWHKVPPSGTGDLWVSVATAAGTGATDTIAAAEWSTGVLMSGTGISVASVFLYQRATSAPSLPAGTLTYTFATGVLSGTLGSWSQTIPAGTDQVYVTQATAAAVSATDAISNTEWAAVQILTQNGVNTAMVNLYQRATSAPSVPGATLTYTFATAALSGTLGSWSTSVPSGTNPVYVTTAQAYGTGLTDAIVTGDWSTPIVFVQNGTNGTNGADGTNGTNGINGTNGSPGATGSPGARGTVQTSASGNTSWSDANANSAIVSLTGTNPRQMDVVTLYGTGFSETRYRTADYPSGSWIALNNYISGNVLVNGTLAATALIADNFSGYTFTGNTFRTGTSGARIVIDYSANNFIHYDSGGSARVTIGGGSGSIYVTTTPSSVPAIYASVATSAAAVAGSNSQGSSSGYGGDFDSVSGAAAIRGTGTTALKLQGRLTANPATYNCTAALADVVPITDNTYSCGASSFRWTSVWAVTGTIQTSDAREKTDITDLAQGLELVNSWRAVKFRWLVSEQRWVTDEDFEGPVEGHYGPRKFVTVPGTRWHYGFLAQQVASTLTEDVGIHILTDKDDPESQQGLRYEEMIAPIVKAIQQLSDLAQAQAATISQLQQELAGLRNG